MSNRTTSPSDLPAAPAAGAQPAPATHHPAVHGEPTSRRDLLLLTLTALGVVYGDIGTSPLYAFRESFHGRHAVPATPTNIFGVLSLILLTVIGFRSSTNLAAAYGIAVTATMAITTILFGVVARRRWRWSPALVGLLVGFFLVIDGAFLGANLIKIPQGGWFPLVVAAVIVVIMTIWKKGIRLVYTRERDMEMSLKRLQQRFQADPPLRVPGTAIFFSANPGGAPAALLTNLKYNGVAHERVLLLTVETADVPHLRDEERVTVEELGAGLYRGRIRYGFMEEPNVPEDLRDLTGRGLPFDCRQGPYFVSRTRVIPTNLPGMAPWREQMFRVLQQNTASPVDFFCLPPTQVFEIATSVEL